MVRIIWSRGSILHRCVVASDGGVIIPCTHRVPAIGITTSPQGLRRLWTVTSCYHPTSLFPLLFRRWASDSHKVVQTSNYATSTLDAKDSEYARYRQHRQNQNGQISPYLLAELQLETIHTQQRIDPDVLQESQTLVQQSWNRHNIRRGEMGPTGTWLYAFANDPSSRRIYQRTWMTEESSSGSSHQSGSQMIQQTVLELEPSDEVLSLSLTVDESCIACLVQDTTTGRRQLRLRHIELDRQTNLEDIGDGTMYTSLVGLEWGAPVEGGDLHSLYVVGTDTQGRPDRVFVSTVHSTLLHVDDPQLLIQSENPTEIVDVQRTKGGQYVSIQVMTKTSNEIYLSSGPASMELVLPRQDHVQYSLDVGERDDIVMLVSDHGSDYRLLETSVWSLPMDPTSISVSNEITQGPKTVIIKDMDLFRDYLVLYEVSTDTGYQQITIKERGSHDTSHAMTVPLNLGMDKPCIQVSPVGNICFGATSLQLVIETPMTPPAIYEVDFPSSSLVAVDEADSCELTTNDYKQERVFVSSQDGTQVPLSLFYQPDDSKDEASSLFSFWNWFGSTTDNQTNKRMNDKTKPVVLIGYGSYGESVNLGYDPVLQSLLQKGYVLAFAHTRGGGELGNAWYHKGRREHKPKAIEDFEACAMYLKGRWKGKLIAKGFSAAGIILGAAVNRRPDLFDTLVLTNPFLDLYATMTNPNLYLTPHEWDEFGNPIQDQKIDRLLRSYCPISNIAPVTDDYPRCLLIGTLDDENVPFWNPTIFAKKIRDRATKKDIVSLHVEERGGHHLGQQRLQVAALELAFILQDEMGNRE